MSGLRDLGDFVFEYPGFCAAGQQGLGASLSEKRPATLAHKKFFSAGTLRFWRLTDCGIVFLAARNPEPHTLNPKLSSSSWQVGLENWVTQEERLPGDLF